MPVPRSRLSMSAPPRPNAFRFQRRGLDDRLHVRLSTDAYHYLRTTDWVRLTLLFLAVYLALNLFFASVLWLGGADVSNSDGSFPSLFAFSVQTMATIGYGVLSPNDWLSHTVVTLASFVSIVFNAVVTGVFFGKFSTPSAKVLWSEVCVVADDGGVPTLMFRCANARSTALVEATVRVAATREETTSRGELVRRIYDLQLRRSTSPVFALSWTVYHPIDASSPLYGRTPEQLAAESTGIIITLTGIDDSLASSVHSRMLYDAAHILFGRRFADVMLFEGDQRVLDFTRFHDTEPE